jgi:hypothetical protein
VKTIFGEGRGKQGEPNVEHLSEMVEELNERFALTSTRRGCSTALGDRAMVGGCTLSNH